MRPVVVPFFIPHLGCPHRCVFCDQEKIAGGRGVLPTAEDIRAKVAAWAASSPGRGIAVAFYGGTFTALPRADQHYLLAALQPLVAAGSVGSVRLSTRPDAVDADSARFLRSMGVATVELGVQSMDDEVLQLSRRGHTAAHVDAAVAALQAAGLSVGVQLMPGLPGDTFERSVESLCRVLSLKPAFLRIYPTLVIAGTDLADLYRRGLYRPLSLEGAVYVCKEMVRKARLAKVPVVRLGLQPTAELASAGVVLAGPYHPAFGQLVESELYFDVMCELAAGLPRESCVSLTVPAGRVSDVVGHKKRNVARQREQFGVTVNAVVEDKALQPGQVAVKAIPPVPPLSRGGRDGRRWQ